MYVGLTGMIMAHNGHLRLVRNHFKKVKNALQDRKKNQCVFFYRKKKGKNKKGDFGFLCSNLSWHPSESNKINSEKPHQQLEEVAASGAQQETRLALP